MSTIDSSGTWEQIVSSRDRERVEEKWLLLLGMNVLHLQATHLAGWGANEASHGQNVPGRTN